PERSSPTFSPGEQFKRRKHRLGTPPNGPLSCRSAPTGPSRHWSRWLESLSPHAGMNSPVPTPRFKALSAGILTNQPQQGSLRSEFHVASLSVRKGVEFERRCPDFERG